MGYLPLALSQAKLYFQGYLSPSAKAGDNEKGGAEREPWLDYKGTPVKWHIPTGTLYDLLCRYSDHQKVKIIAVWDAIGGTPMAPHCLDIRPLQRCTNRFHFPLVTTSAETEELP